MDESSSPGPAPPATPTSAAMSTAQMKQFMAAVQHENARLRGELQQVVNAQHQQQQRAAQLEANQQHLRQQQQQTAAPPQQPTPPHHNVMMHKPKLPSVFNADRDEFEVWRDGVVRYFGQVGCTHVGLALLDFVTGAPAAELRSFLEERGVESVKLDLATCLNRIEPVCVSNTRAEKLRRALMRVSGATPAELVRKFWLCYDTIPVRSRPDATWAWTIFLMVCDSCNFQELEKELRKEVYRGSPEGEVTDAEFRKMTHLAVGISSDDGARKVSFGMDVDALHAVAHGDAVDTEPVKELCAVVSKLSTKVDKLYGAHSPAGKKTGNECLQYARGHCTYGLKCRFVHPFKKDFCLLCGSSSHIKPNCTVHPPAPPASLGGAYRPAAGRGRQ